MYKVQVKEKSNKETIYYTVNLLPPSRGTRGAIRGSTYYDSTQPSTEVLLSVLLSVTVGFSCRKEPVYCYLYFILSGHVFPCNSMYTFLWLQYSHANAIFLYGTISIYNKYTIGKPDKQGKAVLILIACSLV